MPLPDDLTDKQILEQVKKRGLLRKIQCTLCWGNDKINYDE